MIEVIKAKIHSQLAQVKKLSSTVNRMYDVIVNLPVGILVRTLYLHRLCTQVKLYHFHFLGCLYIISASFSCRQQIGQIGLHTLQLLVRRELVQEALHTPDSPLATLKNEKLLLVSSGWTQEVTSSPTVHG